MNNLTPSDSCRSKYEQLGRQPPGDSLPTSPTSARVPPFLHAKFAGEGMSGSPAAFVLQAERDKLTCHADRPRRRAAPVFPVALDTFGRWSTETIYPNAAFRDIFHQWRLQSSVALHAVAAILWEAPRQITTGHVLGPFAACDALSRNIHIVTVASCLCAQHAAWTWSFSLGEKKRLGKGRDEVEEVCVCV